MKKRYILLVIVIILIAGLAYASTFTLKDIEVNGCIMASEDEVRDTITENVIYPNTLILQIQNKIKPIEKPSFVAKMDIDYVSKNKVKVDIYEKSVAGCVEYMENYVYFDKDGVVLETSKEQFDRVPCIRGLKVNRWEMGEKLIAMSRAGSAIRSFFVQAASIMQARAARVRTFFICFWIELIIN